MHSSSCCHLSQLQHSSMSCPHLRQWSNAGKKSKLRYHMRQILFGKIWANLLIIMITAVQAMHIFWLQVRENILPPFIMLTFASYQPCIQAEMVWAEYFARENLWSGEVGFSRGTVLFIQFLLEYSAHHINILDAQVQVADCLCYRTFICAKTWD